MLCRLDRPGLSTWESGNIVSLITWSISSPTTDKTTNKKDNTNSITKYVIQNIPTPTKQYSRTQKIINKIKNTTTKTIRKIKNRLKTSPKLQPYTIPQSTFLLRPPHITLQHNLSSVSSSNHSSLLSSSFTSNDCLIQSFHHSNNTSNHFKTNYQRLFYCTSSSISSNHITHNDDTSLPTTNIVTPFGIQKLIESDRKKQNIIIPSKHGYQYDSPFHSSDSERCAPSVPSSHNTYSNVSTKPSTSIQTQPNI